MLKKTFIIVALLPLFIAGCSSDQRYKREVEGNENYLKSPALKPLIAPEGVKLPVPSNEYYINKAAKEGPIGKALDIRPPELPLPSISDSYATYDEGKIKFDSPQEEGFWSKIPNILSGNNIITEKSDNSVIKTGTRTTTRGDDLIPVEATYLLKRQLIGGREYITVELTSLKKAGENLTGVIENQYYTVDFFNMLMNPNRFVANQVSN